MLLIRKQKLSEAEERIVNRWVESTAPTDPERVTYVSRTAGVPVEQVREALNDPRIQDAIYSEQSRIDRESGVDITNILTMLVRTLYYDVAELVDPATGEMVPLHKLSQNIRAAIGGIKITKHETVVAGEVVGISWGFEYKLVDKLASLKLAMQHKGLFELDNAQKSDAIKDLLARIYDKDSKLPLAANMKPLPPTVPKPGAESVDVAVVRQVDDLPVFENPYKVQ